MRLHIAFEGLPEDAAVYFGSSRGDRVGPFFRASMVDPASFWGPTVESEEVIVEVRVCGAESLGGLSGSVDKVAHYQVSPKLGIRHAGSPTGDECLVDLRCASPPAEAAASDVATSVAAFFVVRDDGTVGGCTGTLLNDADASTWIPYFLTARHCVTTAEEAATLEVYWDYKRVSCGASTSTGIGPYMGSTLLAAVEESDSTLLRLHSIPPGPRLFLGWISDPQLAFADGQKWFRLHHPGSRSSSGGLLPLSYNEGLVEGLTTCLNKPRGNFTISEGQVGDVWHGSSGSSMYVNVGHGPQVVGQLWGPCSIDDSCLGDMRADGSFYVTFQAVERWLRPPQPPVIIDISPKSGPVGTVVSISGQHLDETQVVSFAGVLGTFYMVSSSFLRAVVPEGATSGYLGLATPYGTAYAPTGFTVAEPNLSIPFGAPGDLPFVGDFNADGRSDFGVFRLSRNSYYVDLGRDGWQSDQDLAVGFGVAGDLPFAGDFDGDGYSDFGVFRPSTGWYYVDLARNGGQGGRYLAAPFGASGDLPFVGDFDRDGRDEFGVYRPSKGFYYVDFGRNGWHPGEDLAVPFGIAEDLPFVGDFDGDGYSDFGVFRPSSGWYYCDLGRNGGQDGRYLAIRFGAPGDLPFAADFDGDGKDEFGVFRPSNGFHYVDLGRDGWQSGRDIARPFGVAGDVPFVGRFNADGRSDFGVFRPSQGWYYVDLGN